MLRLELNLDKPWATERALSAQRYVNYSVEAPGLANVKLLMPTVTQEESGPGLEIVKCQELVTSPQHSSDGRSTEASASRPNFLSLGPVANTKHLLTIELHLLYLIRRFHSA